MDGGREGGREERKEGRERGREERKEGREGEREGETYSSNPTFVVHQQIYTTPYRYGFKS